MEIKTDIKMKPLKTGRQLFSWFRTDAIDEQLNKHQLLSRRIFRFSLLIIVTAIVIVSNLSLFSNHTSKSELGELFFEFFQFDLTLYAISAIIVTFDPKIASLFRKLENICSACKDFLLFYAQKKFQLICGRTEILDPDERLAMVNEKCERFYRIFIKISTKWIIGSMVLTSVASVLICQIKYGIGRINMDDFFHPIRLV